MTNINNTVNTMNNSSNNLYIIVAENGVWLRKDAGTLKDFGRSVREHVAPVRWISEKMFSGYREQMENLRRIDDQIQIWTKDLDQTLKNAQKSRKEGKILDVIFWLGQINNRLKLVSEKKKEITDIQDEHIDQFFGTTDQEIPDDYFSSGEDRIVEASLWDDTKRQIATWKAHNMYKKKLETQKRALITLLNMASSTVLAVDSALSKMSAARAKGDISTYVQFLGKISEQQMKFEKQFRNIYDANFAEMVTRIKEKKIKEQGVQQDEVKLNNKNIEENLTSEIPDIEIPNIEDPEKNRNTLISEPETEKQPTERILDLINKDIENNKENNSSKIIDVSSPGSDNLIEEISPITKKEIDEEEKDPVTLNSQNIATANKELDFLIIKNNHEKFYKKLSLAAKNNNLYTLAGMMLQYSEKIDDVDPDTSLKLLTIAEGILNG